MVHFATDGAWKPVVKALHGLFCIGQAIKLVIKVNQAACLHIISSKHAMTTHAPLSKSILKMIYGIFYPR